VEESAISCASVSVIDWCFFVKYRSAAL
jgi:hypothetical protein